jgi:hypothetical protein
MECCTTALLTFADLILLQSAAVNELEGHFCGRHPDDRDA